MCTGSPVLNTSGNVPCRRHLEEQGCFGSVINNGASLNRARSRVTVTGSCDVT